MIWTELPAKLLALLHLTPSGRVRHRVHRTDAASDIEYREPGSHLTGGYETDGSRVMYLRCIAFREHFLLLDTALVPFGHDS
jgi:hypothetical protein